jgi:hypothetical protein
MKLRLTAAGWLRRTRVLHPPPAQSPHRYDLLSIQAFSSVSIDADCSFRLVFYTGFLPMQQALAFQRDYEPCR